LDPKLLSAAGMAVRCLGILLLLALAATPARARQPLLRIDVQIGGGLDIGDGGAAGPVWRAAPFTFTLLADYAVNTQPWVTLFGGLRGEALSRGGIGALFGARVHPYEGLLHIGAAAVAIVAPYTIAGLLGEAGLCARRALGEKIALCGDLEATAYFLGSDVPPGKVVTQLQLVFGVSFDAL
jgi:hypothetical protein